MSELEVRHVPDEEVVPTGYNELIAAIAKKVHEVSAEIEGTDYDIAGMCVKELEALVSAASELRTADHFSLDRKGVLEIRNRK